ncbi:MAG: hypothetical protein WKF84_00920 [Pyrinomonadaceae bacterium]
MVIVADIVEALAHEHGGGSFGELREWVGALQRQTLQHRRDLEMLMPWVFAVVAALNRPENLSAEDQEDWTHLIATFDVIPTPAQIPEFCANALRLLDATSSASALVSAFNTGLAQSNKFLARLTQIARTCDRYVEEMDFTFLFDKDRKVFAIGYNVSERRRDNSYYYDLLASESRLASFVAIAKGDIPQEHWFYLGRQLTSVSGGRALISWTATMFEYLMPLLVMRSYNDTLLHQTYQSIVSRQIEYGQRAQRAVGHLRVRLQRARYPTQLPVRTVRRARPGPQARLERRSRRLALLNNSRRDDLTSFRSRKCAAVGSRRRARQVWFLRSDRLHAGAASTGTKRAIISQLHEPPSGHDAGVAGKYFMRQRIPAPLPR